VDAEVQVGRREVVDTGEGELLEGHAGLADRELALLGEELRRVHAVLGDQSGEALPDLVAGL
jgi:hypothetical protein